MARLPGPVRHDSYLQSVLAPPRLYPDPTRIDPERWLTKYTANLTRNSFLPFSNGQRGCIGASFAWAELTMVITILMQRWRLVFTPGAKVRQTASSAVHPAPA